MVEVCDGNKTSASDVATGLGFVVRKVAFATADDLEERSGVAEQLTAIKLLIRERKRAAAERERLAALEQHRRREAEAREIAESIAEKERHRETALAKGAGDILSIQPESELRGNVLVATICAKIELFFSAAMSNRSAIMTSISLDFATFQAGYNHVRSNELIAAMLRELVNFLKIEEGVSDLLRQARDDAFSVDNKVNSISSRTHVFGGSGLGLFLSALDADAAVRRDQRHIRELRSEQAHRSQQVAAATVKAQQHQQLSEFRAKTIASILLVGCGKADAIKINMPAQLQQFLVRG